MDDQYEMHVKVPGEALASEWYGTLLIQLDSDTASGNLQLPTQYADALPFKSNKVSESGDVEQHFRDGFGFQFTGIPRTRLLSHGERLRNTYPLLGLSLDDV